MEKGRGRTRTLEDANIQNRYIHLSSSSRDPPRDLSYMEEVKMNSPPEQRRSGFFASPAYGSMSASYSTTKYQQQNKERSKITPPIAVPPLATSGNHNYVAMISPRRRRDEKDNSPKYSVPELTERLEKLESFSNTLSRDVLELCRIIITEAKKEAPFADTTEKEELVSKCRIIQEYCIFNKPAKTWTSTSEVKVAERAKSPKKAIINRQYYEMLSLPIHAHNPLNQLNSSSGLDKTSSAEIKQMGSSYGSSDIQPVGSTKSSSSEVQQVDVGKPSEQPNAQNSLQATSSSASTEEPSNGVQKTNGVQSNDSNHIPHKQPESNNDKPTESNHIPPQPSEGKETPVECNEKSSEPRSACKQNESKASPRSERKYSERKKREKGRTKRTARRKDSLNEESKSSDTSGSSTPAQDSNEKLAELSSAIPSDLLKRRKVVCEIIATEIDYIRDLGILIGMYERPLLNDMKDVVPLFELRVLFKNCDDLFDVNQQLLNKLCKEASKADNEQRIGKIFLELIPQLNNYNTYCANQGMAQETMKRLLAENPRFSQYAESVKQQPECRSLELDSFLMKPYQRITRYPLLLKELKQNTPQDWPDAHDLKLAIDKVGEVVWGANETERTVEQYVQSMEIKEKFVIGPKDTLLKQLHKYKHIMDRSVKRLDETGTLRKSHLWLFDEVLILSSSMKGGKYKPLKVVSASKIFGYDISDAGPVKSKSKFEFQIRIKRKNRKGATITLLAASQSEKDEWLKLLPSEVAETAEEHEDTDV